jgi:hypothetical protein
VVLIGHRGGFSRPGIVAIRQHCCRKASVIEHHRSAGGT